MLDGAAFANAVGLIRVNEAAGVGNRQINAAAIGRAQTASDAVLATMTSQTVPTTPATARSASNRVTLRAGTFARAAGLIQINQAAGNGNASVNAFALQIHP